MLLSGAPSPAKQRVSLRSRVTLLAASCVAGAVALVSLGAYWTVRQNLYAQLDETLWQKAQATVQNKLILETPNGDQWPAGLFGLSGVEVALIDDTGRPLIGTMESLPPISSQEIAVAKSGTPSIRTDGKTDTRVVAVAYQGDALVLAQSWGPTKKQLADLSLVLLLIGGAGVVVAAELEGRRRDRVAQQLVGRHHLHPPGCGGQRERRRPGDQRTVEIEEGRTGSRPRHRHVLTHVAQGIDPPSPGSFMSARSRRGSTPACEGRRVVG